MVMQETWVTLGEKGNGSLVPRRFIRLERCTHIHKHIGVVQSKRSEPRTQRILERSKRSCYKSLTGIATKRKSLTPLEDSARARLGDLKAGRRTVNRQVQQD